MTASSTVKRVFSGSPWEKKIGYCRAVRSGNFIAVSGTAPMNPDGTVHGPGDPYLQTRRCLDIIGKALEELGAGFEHVVRTRMYVTQADQWQEFGRAHGEYFAENPPATALVEVKALIDPAIMIEIEVDAILP
ncbi:MAG: RidA family protein [Deltaproteobacteria bacterium]|nr:RidA family protein [Deltaproteobacteria bacterium]